MNKQYKVQKYKSTNKDKREKRQQIRTSSQQIYKVLRSEGEALFIAYVQPSKIKAKKITIDAVKALLDEKH